jgi:hypothetical protein
MNRTAQTALYILIAILLAGILVVLIFVARNGIRVIHGGSVSLSGIEDAIELTISDPVTIEMPTPGRIIATGAESDDIPLALSLLPCPTCDGQLLPVRWNLWSGEIEWACPTCGETMTGLPNP